MMNWLPDLSKSNGPRYMAIADVIQMDVLAGKLVAGDRLPPQRDLARLLNIDFTTVARGYVEAKKRGLVDTQIGRGTFVLAKAGEQTRFATLQPDPRRNSVIDLSMNMPPEPTDPELVGRMREGISSIATDLVSLLRYQGFGGAAMDKEAAASWLSRRGMVPSQERIFVAPGAHPAMLAILGNLAKPGDTVLSERITYPGVRAITSQLRVNLVGLPMDADGILPDAFADACVKTTPKALYLNPTLQNPTTITIPERRREEICAVARKYHVPIIEDDAYGFIPAHGPAPLAAMAPDLTWHIGGLAKCIGAGLRLAYVVTPDTRAAWPFAMAMRTANVMASPLSVALATRWIEDGTADAILRFIRAEASARQQIVREVLPADSYRSDPLAFNIWMPLTNGWNRSTFSGQMRNSGIGVVNSDAFTVDGSVDEAVRICLGGPISRERLKSAIEFMAHSLERPPEVASTFF